MSSKQSGEERSKSAAVVQSLLEQADIDLNGSRPGDMQVSNSELYSRVLAGGPLALGESYMDGWWEVEPLDVFFEKLLGSDIPEWIKRNPRLLWPVFLAKLRGQGRQAAAESISHHYDLGEVFSRILDSRMIYSCAYWPEGVTDLETAQERKLDLVCRKLHLQPGMRVLDIGCGWGSLAKYLAEHYHCQVVGVTLSTDQAKYGRELTADLPVEIRYQDFRDLAEEGAFDRVVSVGAFEHMARMYGDYMRTAHRALKDGGLQLLHTICKREQTWQSAGTDPWIAKYIFPAGRIPSIGEIVDASEDRFVLEDLHNIGPHYDHTLMAWLENFDRAWPELKGQYDETFRRMWRYYLASCAAAFRTRRLQVGQFVFSKNPSEPYTRVC